MILGMIGGMSKRSCRSGCIRRSRSGHALATKVSPVRFCPSSRLLPLSPSHSLPSASTSASASAPRQQQKKIKTRGSNAVDAQLVPGDKPLMVKEEAPELGDALDTLLDSSPPKRPKLHLWNTSFPRSNNATPLGSSSPILVGHFLAPLDPPDDPNEPDEQKSPPLDEATRLKGAVWPGMAIFDSATTEMKRKRNQKKDVSVLDQLEQNSLEVEPTEIIYFPFGYIKKQRRISGRVDSSSPLPEELPPPPPPPPPPVKRKATTRPALTEKDVNGSNAPRKMCRRQRQSPTGPRDHAQTRGSRPKAAFSVHRDSGEVFGHQGGMNVLNSAFEPPLSSQQQFHSSGVNLTQQFAPANCTPYIPADASGLQSVGSYFPHQVEYGPANVNFYGPYGYDLAAFLAHNLPTAPYGQMQTQDAPEKLDDESVFPLDATQTSAGPPAPELMEGASCKIANEGDAEKEKAVFYTPEVKPMFPECFNDQIDGLMSLSDLGHDFDPVMDCE